MIPIEYSDNFKNNQNLVILISNISDLTKINIPILDEFNLKNTSFLKNLSKKNELNLNSFSKNTLISNVIIKVVNAKTENPLLVGSSLSAKFDFTFGNNISFYFSKSIILLYLI